MNSWAGFRQGDSYAGRNRNRGLRLRFVLQHLPTARSERIQVQLREIDEVDQILLVPNPEEGSQ